MNTPSHTILATGSALPSLCLSNEDLRARGVDTTDDWVRTRTGITQRYICGAGETTATLATAAAKQALQRANIQPSQLGAIVVATCTPDFTFPSVAAITQGAIGAPTTCAVLDVNAACSGFVHALATAQGLLAHSSQPYALVIGAETFSKVVDWNDRGTCVLFGDGAGAIVVKREDTNTGKGILGIELGADGTQIAPLKSSGGVATTQTAGVVQMQGAEVFKQAVRQMGQPPALLAKLGLTLNDIDWLIPHQANKRILTAAAEALGFPHEKVVITVDKHANTSAASIPLALDAATTDGRLKPGQTILLQAFGAGMAWGSAVVKL